MMTMKPFSSTTTAYRFDRPVLETALHSNPSRDDDYASSSPALQLRRNKTAAAAAVAAAAGSTAGTVHKSVSFLPTAPSLTAVGGASSSSSSSTFLCRRPSSVSQRIPVRSSTGPPTAEEQQLLYEERLAEQRDYVFYARVVNGIRATQRRVSRSRGMRGLCHENEQCLTHVIETRGTNTEDYDDDYSHPDDDFSSSSQMSLGDYDADYPSEDCMFPLEL
jgi:hypothetical protein